MSEPLLALRKACAGLQFLPVQEARATPRHVAKFPQARFVAPENVCKSQKRFKRRAGQNQHGAMVDVGCRTLWHNHLDGLHQNVQRREMVIELQR
jgi:hypothetical protein